MNTVLVVAPHPDDETLGCGGTLLRHKAEGDSIHWLIMTSMQTSQGFKAEQIESRQQEITEIAQRYQFDSVHELNFPTTQLDSCPRNELVGAFADGVKNISPTILYLPYRYDIHSDHKVTFDVAAACTKSFRYPSIRSVRAYETLSETEYNLDPAGRGFNPNLYVDISGHLASKIEIMQLYKGEMGEAPFPRSAKLIEAQATLRGSVIGSDAAEAFVSLREVI